MKYLTVPRIGSGVDAGETVDPYRADLPAGVDYCGQYDAKTGTYLVAVPDGATVSAKTGRTALSTRKAQTDAMASRSLSEGDVQTWRVG